MPSQGNRISYPCSASTRGKNGRLVHRHRVAYLSAIVNKRGQKRMYLKYKTPTQGEIVVWINTAVADAMLQFLVDYTGKKIRGLSPIEKKVLFDTPVRKKRQI